MEPLRQVLMFGAHSLQVPLPKVYVMESLQLAAEDAPKMHATIDNNMHFIFECAMAGNRTVGQQGQGKTGGRARA